jgi:hypothetical protein
MVRKKFKKLYTHNVVSFFNTTFWSNLSKALPQKRNMPRAVIYLNRLRLLLGCSLIQIYSEDRRLYQRCACVVKTAINFFVFPSASHSSGRNNGIVSP